MEIPGWPSSPLEPSHVNIQTTEATTAQNKMRPPSTETPLPSVLTVVSDPACRGLVTGVTLVRPSSRL
jgi:hypothetical protein